VTLGQHFELIVPASNLDYVRLECPFFARTNDDGGCGHNTANADAEMTALVRTAYGTR
jgi:hypothetical protein